MSERYTNEKIEFERLSFLEHGFPTTAGIIGQLQTDLKDCLPFLQYELERIVLMLREYEERPRQRFDPNFWRERKAQLELLISKLPVI